MKRFIFLVLGVISLIVIGKSRHEIRLEAIEAIMSILLRFADFLSKLFT